MGFTATQIAAARTGQYFPTPDRIVSLIVDGVKIEQVKPSIIDPSCGEGIALACLGKEWTAETWGNELSRDRYEKASGVLDHCTLGPQETLKIDGYFDLAFVNPPYDIGEQGRMEVEHVGQAIDWLRGDGVFVAIVPLHVLAAEEFWRKWHASMLRSYVRRFPDPEYEDFSQVVVFGQKNNARSNYYWERAKNDALTYRTILNGNGKIEPLNGDLLVTLRARSQYSRDKPVTGMSNSLPSASAILADVRMMGSVLDLAECQALTVPSESMQIVRPAMPVRHTHVVQMAAAGMLNGQEVELDGHRYLVAGSSEKYTVMVVHEEETDETVTTKTVETEKLAYQIVCFSLEDGRVLTIDSRDKETYQEFVKENIEPLIEIANRTNPPYYDMDYEHLLDAYAKVHSPRKLPGREEDGLLVAQKHVVAALLDVLHRSKAAILVGEMGVGKTCSSLATMAIRSGMLAGKPAKIVILCPPVVAPKWVEEAKAILRDVPNLEVRLVGQTVKRAHIVPGYRTDKQTGWDWLEAGAWPRAPHAKKSKCRKPILDAQELMEHDGPAVLVISYQTAKDGAVWDFVLESKRKTKTWTTQEDVYGSDGRFLHSKVIEHEQEVDVFYCPDCFKDLEDEDGRPWTTDDDLISVKDPDARKRARRVKRKCPYCQAPLWQVLPFSYGGRWPIAEFISQRYGNRYSLIVDECHNTRSSDTDIGLASADLIYNASHVMAMTGTIFNGMASSLFYLMYRLSGDFRKIYGHDECSVFVNHHGFSEKVTTKRGKKTSHGYSGYGRKETVTVKQAPGASPEMVAMLMPFTCFLTLDDVGADLPPKVEYIVPAKTSGSMKMGLDMLSSLERAAKAALVRSDGKDKGPYMRWFNAALGWPDCPVEETVEEMIIPGVSPNGVLPKDGVLVNLVRENLSSGRGVAVFFEQVHRRNAMPRVQSVLNDYGIDTCMLTVSVKAEDRMPWIEKETRRMRAKGQEPVMLANGNLVKEGIDLLMFPTIIEVGQHYIITDLMQRLARSWRLGQEKPVDVYYLYYEDTQQEKALLHIAKKVKAAYQIEGKVAEGLADFGGEQDFIQDLMREADKLEKGQLAKLMQARIISDVPGAFVAPVVVVPVKRQVTTTSWEEVAGKWKRVISDKKKPQAQMSFLDIFG